MRQIAPVFLALSLASAALCQSTPKTIPAQAALVDRLSQYLDSLARRDEFSGVVILAKDGKPAFERAYGYADRGAKRRNTLATSFNLGSINKVFTATAI